MYQLQPDTKAKKSPLMNVYSWSIVAVVIAVIAINLVTSDGDNRSTAQSAYHVVYRVTTTECTDFSVTYAMPNGTAQKDERACPSDDVIGDFYGSRGDFVYLSAQNTGRSGNNVIFTCLIEVDRKMVAQVQSVGFANIASCSGSIP